MHRARATKRGKSHGRDKQLRCEMNMMQKYTYDFLTLTHNLNWNLTDLVYLSFHQKTTAVILVIKILFVMKIYIFKT